ncbi:MAG TPA: polysaccharide deacetylase family protein [Cellvibrio sp.]|nr:polysaccharide deacetylase family protein [Cellvibrio sp.]
MSMLKLALSLVIVLLLASSTQAAVVLEYHHVSNSTPKSTSISPERFNQQMDYLQNHHFKVVPLTELAELLRAGKLLPDKTVAITFDDSYASVYQAAYPLLKQRGWPFTFFVNTDAVGSSPLFVSWPQLREMAKNGVTIANHSQYHRHMPRRSKDETLAQWRERTSQEIQAAEKMIEREIGSSAKIFAYPFGEYDIELQAVLKKLDYIAFGQQSGPLGSQLDLQSVPRFPFGGSFTELDDFIMKVNSLPMPVTGVKFFSDKKSAMNNLLVKQGDKPYLQLQVSDKSLLGKIHCFATGQGAIAAEVIDGSLWVQARQPLPQGRTRYNCTAASAEKGRFYWYTQQWLATNKQGEWTYSD